MTFSVARLGARSCSLRSLSTPGSVFRSHAWRLHRLGFYWMSGSSIGLGLFRSGVSAAVSLLVRASPRHAWRTRTSSCAATWRFGDSITGSLFLLYGVTSTPCPSPLSVDGAAGFVIAPSFRLTGFSRESSRAPGRGVPGAPVLPPRGASGALLAQPLPGAGGRSPGLLASFVIVPGIAASRLRARAFRSRSKRLFRVGSGPVPSHYHAQEVRRQRDVSRPARAVHSAARPAGVGHDRADSAGGSRARPQVRFREAASRRRQARRRTRG